MKPHRAIASLVPLALVVALVGCAVPAAPGGAPTEREPLVLAEPDPMQEVWALTNVIDDGSGAKLCPVVLESYPPQCGGAIPIDGWTWDGLPLEQEGNVRWGFYAVYGSYDGERLTVTQPAEFGGAIDVMGPTHTGALSTDEATRILGEIQEDLPGDFGSAIGDGYITIDVTYDDGSLQSQLDERYGDGAVQVTSLLRPYDRA
jgi:hypothetical protein